MANGFHSLRLSIDGGPWVPAPGNQDAAEGNAKAAERYWGLRELALRCYAWSADSGRKPGRIQTRQGRVLQHRLEQTAIAVV